MTPRLERVVEHAWDLSPREAVDLQRRLAGRVIAGSGNDPVTTLGGVDVGFEERGAVTRAAVTVLEARTLAPLDEAVARLPTRFPYVPGLLSFRELPAVLLALERLAVLPDLLLCDGQGLAHPRRFGIACHLGVLLDRPAVGVGKTRLTGAYAEPADARGSTSPLRDGAEIIGQVLRTRQGVKPLFVSVGHRITLDDAVSQVLAAAPRFRLPEPIRAAHRLASQVPRRARRAGKVP
ncbi:MAG: deoxyribonuclease V [Pseudomonadota bacterium]|nr:deoxyribonuclease V [Pseudomonadota bacterium]